MKRNIFFAILFLAAMAVSAFPQSRETGAILGKSWTTRKNRSPGVDVLLTGKN